MVIVLIASGAFLLRGETEREGQVAMAVEFTNHAAAAYIAQDRGWYEKEGLNVTAHKSYVTGMALASALARRDIQVAYICLVPAISAYANAKVPIKVVAGTHRYGYALVADPEVVAEVGDLANEGVRIGCVREGGAVDLMLNRTLEKHGLDRQDVLQRVRRMNPPKQLLAIKTGQLDAAFLPEQWASMAEDFGFQMLLTAQDVWPRMQGSVLVVKQEVIDGDPDFVRKLVAVTGTATRWLDEHPDEAAGILVRQLSLAGEQVAPEGAAKLTVEQDMRPETMRRSMKRLEYSTDLSLEAVQEVIDYAAELGYIKRSFPAAEIVDRRFLR